mmetsp:Transcript_1317/g.2293  ORF Transcript_1317/g.2293 Transcript_1317/m.2293 type:complete len:401 (-) Transcript_1317:174-1376(-)
MDADLGEDELVRRVLHDGVNGMQAFGWAYPAHSALILGRDDALRGFKKFLAGTTCICKSAKRLERKEAESYVTSLTKDVDNLWPDIFSFIDSMGAEKKQFAPQLRFIVATLSKYSPSFSEAAMDSPLGAEYFRKDSNSDPLSELDTRSSLLSILGEVEANKSMQSLLDKFDTQTSLLSLFSPSSVADPIEAGDNEWNRRVTDGTDDSQIHVEKLKLGDIVQEGQTCSEEHDHGNCPNQLLSRLRNARIKEVVSWARKIRCRAHRKYTLTEGGMFRCKESCYIAIAPLKRSNDATSDVNRTRLDLFAYSILGGWRTEEDYAAKRSPWFSIFVPNISKFQIRSCDLRQRSVSIWHGPQNSETIVVFSSSEEAAAWCSFLSMFLTTLRDALAWHSTLEKTLML